MACVALPDYIIIKDPDFKGLLILNRQKTLSDRVLDITIPAGLYDHWIKR